MLIVPDWITATTECLLFLFVHILLRASSSWQTHGIHALGYEKPAFFFFSSAAHILLPSLSPAAAVLSATSNQLLRCQWTEPCICLPAGWANKQYNTCGLTHQSRFSSLSIPSVSLEWSGIVFTWVISLYIPSSFLSGLHPSADKTGEQLETLHCLLQLRTLKPTWRKETWH